MTAHVTIETIDAAITVLDGWSGPLTWVLLAEALALRHGNLYSRQALEKHHRIKKAFQMTKVRLKSGDKPKRTGPVEVVKLQEHIDRLEATVARLESENNNLLDQFRRWATNAHQKGLTVEMLNVALPPLDRRNPK